MPGNPAREAGVQRRTISRGIPVHLWELSGAAGLVAVVVRDALGRLLMGLVHG